MSSTKSAASKRRKAKQSYLSTTYSFSMIITQNLANMVTVAACSGSVLLGLLVAKRF